MISEFQRHLLAFAPHWTATPVFTMNVVVHLEGALSRSALSRAFRALVTRHDVLRTVYRDGSFTVLPALDVEVEPLHGEPAHAPVDITERPIRLRVSRVADDEHVLALNLHHLIADPTTLRLVLVELGALYAGTSLPPAVQYPEYVAHEQAQLDAGHDTALDWWTKALKDVAPAPPPCGDPAPFATRTALLTAAQADALDRAARRWRSTTFATLLAALSVQLGRPIQLATAFSRRDQPRWRTVVGPCMLFTPLLIPTAPELTAEHAATVRDLVVGAQRHSRFRFAAVPELDAALVARRPFVELVTETWPETIPFGDLTCTVTTAAGPPDTGQQAELGIRWRRTESGLRGHISGDGRDWPAPEVLAMHRRMGDSLLP